MADLYKRNVNTSSIQALTIQVQLTKFVTVEKPIHDYVKKLLGRIVFLHFLKERLAAFLQARNGVEAIVISYWNIFKNANERQRKTFLMTY